MHTAHGRGLYYFKEYNLRANTQTDCQRQGPMMSSHACPHNASAHGKGLIICILPMERSCMRYVSVCMHISCSVKKEKNMIINFDINMVIYHYMKKEKEKIMGRTNTT